MLTDESESAAYYRGAVCEMEREEERMRRLLAEASGLLGRSRQMRRMMHDYERVCAERDELRAALMAYVDADHVAQGHGAGIGGEEMEEARRTLRRSRCSTTRGAMFARS